jgi:hypothetical protein
LNVPRLLTRQHHRNHFEVNPRLCPTHLRDGLFPVLAEISKQRADHLPRSACYASPESCGRVTGIARHQFVITQPATIFFSAAYFAAVSLTRGAIMESSAVIDTMFHFLLSQV